MLTANELKANVGKLGALTVDGFVFPVVIQDAKMAYGQHRYLVAPLWGYNDASQGFIQVPYTEQWVAATRVTIQEAK